MKDPLLINEFSFSELSEGLTFSNRTIINERIFFFSGRFTEINEEIFFFFTVNNHDVDVDNNKG